MIKTERLARKRGVPRGAGAVIEGIGRALERDPAPRALARQGAFARASSPREGFALPAEFVALAGAGAPPGALMEAFIEAERAGVAPYDALALSGAVAERELLETLARALGVGACRVEDFAGASLSADDFGEAMRTGEMRLRDAGGRDRIVVAARGAAVARLALARRGQPRSDRLALAAPAVFADIAVAAAGAGLAARAAEGPARLFPALTVAHGLPRPGPGLRWGLLAAAGAAVVSAFVWDVAAMAVMTLTGVIFFVLSLFRVRVAGTPPEEAVPPPRVDPRHLPVYTVLVPLHREGEAVVAGLLDALEALDYPPAKLDLKLLVEAGDAETLAALAARPPRAGIETLKLPPGGPTTKPRALNVGLMAARGSFLTIFDAEDRPDPQQLRAALDAFARGGADVACVQARLAIDNIADGWLTRQFAIEYAALFDVALPALAALDLPIALGGTSNHFRSRALRQVGGWDAGNVTEDADLGLRLARFGWRTRTIASTTWEEAPTRVWPWIKQRTRWMKGFMVTAVIHGRSMGDLARSVPPASLLASQILIGGVALTALAYPVVAGLILRQIVDGSLFAPAESLAGAVFAGFHLVNLILGLSAGLSCAWMGVDRRGPPRLALDLATMPIYWLLVGVAAWRALVQLVFARAADWEKTEHGVSRRRATPQM